MARNMEGLWNDDEDKEDFTIEKSMLLEAWAKYRPSSQGATPEGGSSPVSVRRKDVGDIYGENFMSRLMAGAKGKQKLEDNMLDYQRQVTNHLNSLLMNRGRSQEDGDIFAQRHIPDEEIHLIEDFLDKFIFVGDASSTKEQIDLKLALKALPQKIEEHNIYRIDLLHFNMIQRALIAFQNDDQDELFNFYDNRNKQRLRKLLRKANQNDEETQSIKELASVGLSALNRFFNMIGTAGISAVPESMRSDKPFMKVMPLDNQST